MDLTLVRFARTTLSVGSDAPAQALADAYGIGTPFSGVTLSFCTIDTSAMQVFLPENTVSTEAWFGNEVLEEPRRCRPKCLPIVYV